MRKSTINPFSSMIKKASRVHKNAPLRLTFIILSQLCMDSSKMVLVDVIPALFISMSIFPYSFFIFLNSICIGCYYSISESNITSGKCVLCKSREWEQEKKYQINKTNWFPVINGVFFKIFHSIYIVFLLFVIF